MTLAAVLCRPEDEPARHEWIPFEVPADAGRPRMRLVTAPIEVLDDARPEDRRYAEFVTYRGEF
jgi:hypothetical protein